VEANTKKTITMKRHILYSLPLSHGNSSNA